MPKTAATDAERQEVRALLEKYGGEVDDFFKIWPPDKLYFFNDKRTACIAYGVRHHVAACIFDPAGKPEDIPQLLRDFTNYCEDNHWRVIFIQTTEEFLPSFEACGYHRLLIGADAFINTEKFTLETSRNKYFRNLVNRIDKQGYKLSYHLPPHKPALIKELRQVSNSWLELPNHKEWYFLTGRFHKDYLAQVPLYILRDRSKKILAFANELPQFRPSVVTIDLMRHIVDSPPNTMDFLFIETVKRLHDNGVEWFNLGISPLDGNRFADNGWEKLLNGLFGRFQRFIGFRGLHQFKAKWEPEWEPRYVFFTGSPARLAQAGIAILELLLGKKIKA